jgi:hypothetical protein
MKLPDLATLEGIRVFIKDHELDHSALVKVLDSSNTVDAQSITPETVLGLVVRDYFPDDSSRARIARLMNANRETIDPDLSLSGLQAYISPTEFLALLAEEFPDFVFAARPDIMRRYPEHQWYAYLVESIYIASQDDGVYRIIEILAKKLGYGSRAKIVSLFKAKYPHLKGATEIPSTKSKRPESIDVGVAQLRLALQKGVRLEDIEHVTAAMQAVIKSVREGINETISIGAESIETSLQIDEEKRAANIEKELMAALQDFEERPEIQVDVDNANLTPKAVALATAKMTSLGYKITVIERGGYSGLRAIQMVEIGEKLAARDHAQAQTLVNLVCKAIQANEMRPDVPSRFSTAAVSVAVTALNSSDQQKAYRFISETKGLGNGAALVIRISPVQNTKIVTPKNEIVALVTDLDESNARTLAELIKSGKLLGLACGNGQANERATLTVLDTLLANAGRFISLAGLIPYITQLRNNVAEPNSGMPLRTAYAFQLPDIKHL